jgi:hypothetical protein
MHHWATDFLPKSVRRLGVKRHVRFNSNLIDVRNAVALGAGRGLLTLILLTTSQGGGGRL